MNLSQIHYFKSLCILLVSSIMVMSCNHDPDPDPDPDTPVDYQYKVVIQSPNELSEFQVGDTIPLEVLFTSETGEIVHNISVSVFDKNNADNSLYHVSAHQHVQESFLYKDQLVINESKIDSTSEWLIKGSVWSHNVEDDTISTSIPIIITK